MADLTCDFCGRKVGEDEALKSKFTGKVICGECVKAATARRPDWIYGGNPQTHETPAGQRERVIQGQRDEKEAKIARQTLDLPNYHPKELVEVLDRYVVGQKRAKKALAVSIAVHLKRLKNPSIRFKPNLLMVGPTGSGKTYMVKTLARYLDIPVGFSDATSLTQTGYVGDDVETILYRLFLAAEQDQERAEMGIVFLDEFDKIARKDAKRFNTLDVAGEGVQYNLLKLVEGTTSAVPLSPGGPKSNKTEYIMMDTHNILWIFAGAFEGIHEIVRARLARETGATSIGFGSFASGGRREYSDEELYHMVASEDLVTYGIIPEMVGRIGAITSLSPLGEEEMVKILLEPEEAILPQYWQLFRSFGVELRVPPETVRAIARKAASLGTGARGLHTVIAPLMQELLYRSEPGSTVVVEPSWLEEDGRVFG